MLFPIKALMQIPFVSGLFPKLTALAVTACCPDSAVVLCVAENAPETRRFPARSVDSRTSSPSVSVGGEAFARATRAPTLVAPGAALLFVLFPTTTQGVAVVPGHPPPPPPPPPPPA